MNTDTMDDLNEAVETMGGKWVKLNCTEHPPIEGEIIDFVKRRKTFEGNVVTKRGSDEPRIEWVFTLKVDDLDPDTADDDGLRKLSCNESAQRAISRAIKESGQKAVRGGRLKVGVKSDPKSATEQAEYIARYTPPAAAAKTVDIDDF